MNSSSLMLNDQGQCSALLTREGFFDFNVIRTHCNVSHNVAVVCQHDLKANIVFNNNMSDVKVSIDDGFYRLEMFSSCDIGWFRVDNMCINFYRCPNCLSNAEAHKQCVEHNGHLAHDILRNVTVIQPGDILAENTELSLFWDMFHKVDDTDITLRKHSLTGSAFFAVNCSGICVTFLPYLQYSDQYFDSALFIDYHVPHIINWEFEGRPLFIIMDEITTNSRELWAVIQKPHFQPTTKIDFALCEKYVHHTVVLTKCSDLYTVCDDGTCVHDSLVCDGKPHCQHGEDEADCQHICSDHSHSCMYHCHHRDLCSCSPEYFQCLSGGCVPLQKLCDKISHCVDGSDEPETCVYLKPENLGRPSVSLDVNSYINNLIQKNMAIHHRCSCNNDALLNVNYKIYAKESVCVPPSQTSDIRFLCSMTHIIDNKMRSSFSLDHICIYEPNCDADYTNHCFNGYHLLKCEHTYCVGRFKCPSSYCISFDNICNKVCDCPHCEDESICNKLLCPGMVLIPQMESGLRCSTNVAALKHDINMRQVIHTKGLNFTDDFPVFIRLEDVDNVTSFIFTPEMVVYCEVLHSQFSFTDVKLFHRMVSVRRLLLSHNSIQIVYDSMFAFMAQLVVLDLSHNFITSLSRIMLCSLQNLEYISLHHNQITNLRVSILAHNPYLQVLLLESNNLSPRSVSVDGSFPSLYRLSSDIPRLCCASNTIDFCSPPFPIFVSCSNLITSKALIVMGWLIGLSTSFLSVCCLVLLAYKFSSPDTPTLSFFLIFSVNLSLGELVTSLCLLSYSVINVVFDNVFGTIADHWRYSWQCLSLEGLFSISSRSSLAFAVCLSVHLAIHIPSMIRRKSSKKTVYFQIIFTWVLIISICSAVQILEHLFNIDPYNYLCLPFTTLFPSNPLMLCLQIVMVLLDCLLVMASIVSYGYLLMFAIKRRRCETLQSMGKSKQKLEKLAARLTVLILSTVLTWTPILCAQLLIFLQVAILPNTYLWCILVGFPMNLILDPILLIKTAST